MKTEEAKSLVEQFIAASPENALLYNQERTVVEVGEVFYSRMREYNWGYKSLSRRLGIKRRACKKLLKKDEWTLREMARICHALDLDLNITPKKSKYE